MRLEYAPLLQVQRDLYRMPRGMERFQAYLETMTDAETRDMKLPLSAMNPMGKDHVPALLDQYLAFDADGLSARVVFEAEPRLAQLPGEFKVTLVISDDAMGGWTNRYTSEFNHRFGSKAYFRRGWITGVLWTSETPSEQAVREETLTAVYRAAFIEQHGFARTLGEMMAQEGYAMAMAGCIPSLDADEIDYTREVIRPHLETKDLPTQMACLFGDEAAYALGYAQMGLSARAGFALACADARLRLPQSIQ
ncbi:MAG: hypothetical protein AB7U82_12315 [Blastocatellales bacterium]